MSNRIKVGSDPELWLKNPNSGKFVSAEKIVPGDKLNPHKVNKGTVSVDGFAAEIGIEPAGSEQEFVDNHLIVLEELRKFTVGYDLVIGLDHVIFEEDVYLGQSDKGRELGCDPDFNAYTGVANPTPVPNPRSLRTASGHIHIGWGDSFDITELGHFEDCRAVAKQMDCWVGAPTLLFGKGSVRRSLYGKAGAFRPKGYGIEYRTPDNGWLFNEERMRMVYKNVIAGMEQLYAGKHSYNNFPASQAINGKMNLTDTKLYMASHKIPFIDSKKTSTVAEKITMEKIVA